MADLLTGAVLYGATPVVGESTVAARRDVKAWELRHEGRSTEAP
jgi:hypothetical protein